MGHRQASLVKNFWFRLNSQIGHRHFKVTVSIIFGDKPASGYFCHLKLIILQITEFMKFVKGIYSNLPNHLPRIFEPRTQKKVKDLSDINVEVWLQDIFTVTTVLTDKKNAENQSVQVGIGEGGDLCGISCGIIFVVIA